MIVLRKLSGPPNFLDLTDTPSSYVDSAGKVVGVNNLESGLSFVDVSTNFIDLTDTPTTYSGFEDYFVKVNSAGDGLDFIPAGSGLQEGVTHIVDGSSSVEIEFSSSFSSDQYVLTLGLENKIDTEPSVYPLLIREKTESGFVVDFSGEIDSDNYYLNWRATLNSISGGSYTEGIQEVIDDITPALGGNLDVGSHLIMWDPAPTNTTVSGGYARGYSGNASYMYVSDNSPSSGDGFGTPLYMKSNGTWGTCTAVSGTTQMPCMAMALESGDGAYKNILWNGIIRKGEWGTMSLTPGQVIFVSTVAGGITNVDPGNNHWQQPIGVVIASDTIKFDPGFNPGS